MNKTISINLGGFFFHIDEKAYLKLTNYFNAIKQSLDTEGKDEIISDIESRIAELFQEKIDNNQQVITTKEVADIIAIMGEPEDYNIDNDTSFSDKASKKDYENTRKLYRDSEQAYLGGVAAGLAHYTSIDALWWRILFVISPFISFGTSVIIYMVLWALIPKAVTTTQKLEMKGEPITLASIEKKVKEGVATFSDSVTNLDGEKITKTTKGIIAQILSTLEEMLRTVFKIIGKFLGVILLIIASFTLLGIVIVSISFFFGLPNYSPPFGYNNFPLWLQGVLFLFTVGIPFFFLLLVSLKLLVSNTKTINKTVKTTLIIVWIISLLATIFIFAQKISNTAYEGKVVTKKNIVVQPTDTLFIKMKFNKFYAKNNITKKTYKHTFNQDNNEIIYSNKVKLHLMQTETNTPYLEIEKEADGSSYENARKTAEKIDYNFTATNNTIELNNYFTTDIKNQFKNQEIHLYLYLPNNITLYPDTSIEPYLTSKNSDISPYYGSENYYYQLKNDALQCLNCPEKKTPTNQFLEDDFFKEINN